MTDETDNMILRTLYLPRELDQALKSAAVRGAVSKGELIRDLITTGLQTKRSSVGGYFIEPVSGKPPAKLSAPTRSVVSKVGPKRTVKRLTASAKAAPRKAAKPLETA